MVHFPLRQAVSTVIAAALGMTLAWSPEARAETEYVTPARPARPTPPTIVQPRPVQALPAQPQPIQPQPVQPQPVQPRPVQPQPVQPYSHQSRPQYPHPDQPRPQYPRPARPAPDVDVIVAPQSEQWPSNYVPDNYRLRGYEGGGTSGEQGGGKQICRHADGSRTWSTAGVPCLDERGGTSGGRTWSTK